MDFEKLYLQDIGTIDKRVICPLDPKHSVYEKNFEKHLKKCNSVVKCLGMNDNKRNYIIIITKRTIRNFIGINLCIKNRKKYNITREREEK